MTKNRMFVIAALAVAVALVWVQPAPAQDTAVRDGIQVSLTAVDHWVPNADPQAAAVVQGPVMWDNGLVIPPCFAPNAPCTGDPAGGVNIGYPLPFWPITGPGTGTSCNNVTLQACGQIDSFIETTSAKGKVSVSITIVQGSTTVFSYSKSGLGTAKAGQVLSVSVAGIQLDATAVAGTATLTVVTAVGSSKSSGKTTIVLY